MILQRIAKGIKDQDWFVVTIEVMIVIVGIFLGLQVDNWNEDRKDRDREIILLNNLENELVNSITWLEGTELYQVSVIEKANNISAAWPDAIKLAALSDDWSSYVSDSMFPIPPQVRLATLSQLAESNELQYIGDPEIQQLVMNLYDSIETQKVWIGSISESAYANFLNLEAKVDRVFTLDRLAEIDGMISSGKVVSTPQDFAAKSEIKKLYQRSISIQVFMLEITRGMRHEITEVLDKIRRLRDNEDNT